MLNSHTQIAIPEEGTFFMPLLRRHKFRLFDKISPQLLSNYIDYIKKNAQFHLWEIDSIHFFKNLDKANTTLATLIDGLYSFYAASQGKPIWGDKTPSFFRMVKYLAYIFPGACFIHIIRDGRDLFQSWKKMDPTKGNPAVIALEWKIKVQTIENQLTRFAPSRFLEIKFEDLILDSESNLRTICSFLKLDFEESMLAYWKTSHNFVGKHHSTKIFGSPTPDAINAWATQLTKKEIKVFEAIAGPLLKRKNYRLSGYSSDIWRNKAIAYAHLILGLPQRIFQILSTALILQLSSRFGIASEKAGGKFEDIDPTLPQLNNNHKKS